MRRAADGFGIKPISLLNGVFGSRRSLLNQDLDAYLPEPMLACLCEGTGLPAASVIAMTLAEHISKMNATPHPRGRKTWILPISVLSNKRQRAGLQYCPACLRSDERPYMRRRWRLACATSCSVHGIALLDRCPHCNAIVQPHSSPSIRDCHACGQGLATPTADRPVDEDTLTRQRIYDAVLAESWGLLGGRLVAAPLYFVIVRRLAALVAIGFQAENMQQAIVARLGGRPAPFEREDPRHPLEYLDVTARRRMFRLVDVLLDDWPKTFVEICRAAGTTRSDVIKDMAYVPFALDHVLRDHLDDTPYRASDAEVSAVAAWLRQTRGIATYRDLKAHCGEARAALYRHMDYERIQSRPSWRRADVIAATQIK